METYVDLSRYFDAHKQSYQNALKEIKNGHKYSHWMWFIFPQIKGLGKTETSQLYAIENKEEAIAFLMDPVLGNHIREISKELLVINNNDPIAVMGIPDNLKLCSCMTLFYEVSKEKVFYDVLVKFYSGKEDKKTLRILKTQEG